MSRTTRYKTIYITLIVISIALIFAELAYFKSSFKFLFFTGLVLLIPGRVVGYLWRDFFRGRNLMNSQRWEDSIGYFEKFLTDLQKKPWLKMMIWFSWGTYTRDIEAMTRNNLGAAKLNLGNFIDAERELLIAHQIDSEYPLPYYNLALLAQLQGQNARAIEMLEKAKDLGYSDTTYDKFVHTSSSIMSYIEGRGVK